MLQSLLWDDEVREADFPVLKTDVRVSAQELKMSTSLVDQLTTDFDPDKFGDEYQEQLRKLIAAKIEKGDALDTAATFGEAEAGPPEGGEVIDLMEALRQSVERARASRTGTGSASAASSARQRRTAVVEQQSPSQEGGINEEGNLGEEGGHGQKPPEERSEEDDDRQDGHTVEKQEERLARTCGV